MNTRFLETFVWLSRLKSFNRTAERLHTSQPAISARIVTLEDLLGVPLYERQAKGFELTPAGRRIIERCEKIVALTNDLKQMVHDDDFLDRPLRVGSADIVTLTWLPAFLSRIQADLPKLNLELITDSGINLANALLADELDMAFMVEGLDESRIVNAPLCNYRVDWLCSSGRTDIPEGLTVKDLCDLPIIMPPADTAGYRWLCEYFKRHNPQFDPQAADGHRVQCGYSPATGVEMVARDLGIAAIPTLLARRHIDREEIRVLNVREAFPNWSVVACYKAPPTISSLFRIVEIAQEETKLFAEGIGEKDMWP
ncbi:LysR family transcriptional regulator [Rhizorhabdus wittichii DC-6]|uniref:Transcriptional regulator, LysR family n=1 Tax=Rhizorhabdus wittichii (strain DSM 6014 / CCUG 31198 / JCM 15750 / NBRC 105917 / EY 4224 / RW1) TaxID=392499 RepID=A0A9J9LEA3_RHIWR|nr:transcriptional regulator, LysR family [Rhizorhabdus wittichii RW1]ARR54317.1 LysR family transcriptional regulator [Rhizorhabdus wittichii DC-6]